MSCLKAFEIDLPGFLARPREDEFASFRDHYPRCSECSAEVRAWTELDDRLRRPVGFGVGFAVGFDTESGAAAVAQHPSAGILAGYEADPGALGATERRGLERHLTECPSCRDELRALGRFSPESLVPRPATAPRRPGSRLGPWLASLGRLAWHPAVAYAVLILLMLPIWGPTLSDRVRPEVAVPVSPRSSPSLEDRIETLVATKSEAFSSDVAEEADTTRTRAASLRQISTPAAALPAAVAERRESAPSPKKVLRSAPSLSPASEELERPRQTAKKREQAPGDAVRSSESRPREFSSPAPPLPIAAASRPEAALGFETAFRRRAAPEQREPAGKRVQPAFADAKRQAAGTLAPRVEALAALPAAPLLRLNKNRIVEISVPSNRGEIRVWIPVPSRWSGDREVRIRVSDASHSRELRETRVHEAGETGLEFGVPAAWLAPGLYRVELESPTSGATAVFGFRVP